MSSGDILSSSCCVRNCPARRDVASFYPRSVDGEPAVAGALGESAVDAPGEGWSGRIVVRATYLLPPTPIATACPQAPIVVAWKSCPSDREAFREESKDRFPLEFTSTP